MKILWISNAPWMPSGYGSQTRQVGRRIAASGTGIEFVANDGTRGNVTGVELAAKMNDPEWANLLVRGSGYDRFSRDSVREDLEQSQADWVVSLYDAWVYTQGIEDPFAGLPHVAGWVPVDHWPAPISLYGWLQNGHTAIAMSRFGEHWLRVLSEAWTDAGQASFAVRYAPHAVDDVFQPTDSDFRQSIGVPADAFLVGIVAANWGSLVYDRKGMSDMAAALGMFMADHPDAYVYVHSVTGPGAEMIFLPGCFAFNAVPTERLRFADQYRLKKQDYSDADMAAMYSAFDVLLATSRGEGFGVPVIEAQACGTPVIASNWTAQTELLADEPWALETMGPIRTASGWLVAVDMDYDAKQGANWGKPLITSIALGLRDAHEKLADPATRDGYRDAAIAKAANYRADRVFADHWKPLLDEMEESLKPPNRAARRAARKRRAA
jgi:glycosyltransferase involved in cell wall biosynthesis